MLIVIAFILFAIALINALQLRVSVKMVNVLEETEYEPETEAAGYDHDPMTVRGKMTEIAEAFMLVENATFEVQVYDIDQFAYDFTLATGIRIEAKHIEDDVYHIKEKR